MKKIMSITLVLNVFFIAQAFASTQIYRGNNPRITPTANQFSDGGLKQAELTRPKDTKASSSANAFDETRLLKQSVISSLSARYTSLLTGSSPSNGIINFGDGSTAEYSTASGIRTIVFRDGSGTITSEISFPI